jgi:hypothetical protein
MIKKIFWTKNGSVCVPLVLYNSLNEKIKANYKNIHNLDESEIVFQIKTE